MACRDGGDLRQLRRRQLRRPAVGAGHGCAAAGAARAAGDAIDFRSDVPRPRAVLGRRHDDGDVGRVRRRGGVRVPETVGGGTVQDAAADEVTKRRNAGPYILPDCQSYPEAVSAATDRRK